MPLLPVRGRRILVRKPHLCPWPQGPEGDASLGSGLGLLRPAGSGSSALPTQSTYHVVGHLAGPPPRLDEAAVGAGHALPVKSITIGSLCSAVAESSPRAR